VTETHSAPWETDYSAGFAGGKRFLFATRSALRARETSKQSSIFSAVGRLIPRTLEVDLIMLWLRRGEAE
jgi:hypothetical protein